MSSYVFKFAVISMLLVVLVYPLVESIDTWDGVGPANDTELTVVGLAIAVGLILTLRRLIVLTTAAMELMALDLDSPADPKPTTACLLTAFPTYCVPSLQPLRI